MFEIDKKNGKFGPRRSNISSQFSELKQKHLPQSLYFIIYLSDCHGFYLSSMPYMRTTAQVNKRPTP